jgi:hypothetical protein
MFTSVPGSVEAGQTYTLGWSGGSGGVSYSSVVVHC